jgi:hypothetical protein
LATRLEPAETYKLAFVSAPVFEAQQQIDFELVLAGLDQERSGVEVERIGRRVREACERIGGFAAPIGA